MNNRDGEYRMDFLYADEQNRGIMRTIHAQQSREEKDRMGILYADAIRMGYHANFSYTVETISTIHTYSLPLSYSVFHSRIALPEHLSGC